MSSQRVSEGTFFQAKRSHCLSSRSSSGLGAGSLYVVSSTIIQIIARGFTSREFASRSPFARKFPNPSGTMSACAPRLFVFKIFQALLIIYLHCVLLESLKITFLCCRIITDILWYLVFRQHSLHIHRKKTAIHSLVCLLKSLLLTTCSLISFRLVQQFSNFCDWMARRP